MLLFEPVLQSLCKELKLEFTFETFYWLTKATKEERGFGCSFDS